MGKLIYKGVEYGGVSEADLNAVKNDFNTKIGSTSISSIGDGTVTGAISALKSSINSTNSNLGKSCINPSNVLGSGDTTVNGQKWDSSSAHSYSSDCCVVTYAAVNGTSIFVNGVEVVSATKGSDTKGLVIPMTVNVKSGDKFLCASYNYSATWKAFALK